MWLCYTTKENKLYNIQNAKEDIIGQKWDELVNREQFDSIKSKFIDLDCKNSEWFFGQYLTKLAIVVCEEYWCPSYFGATLITLWFLLRAMLVQGVQKL